jgi:hypothetical protein
MRCSIVLVVAAAFLPATLLSAGEPKVPDNALLKPTFLLSNGSWSGGTAFLLRVADRHEALLVTCHHLFGPATGRERQMSGEQIRANVCAAVGLSMQDQKTIFVAGNYILFPDARSHDEHGAERDLAAFVVKSDKPPPAFEFAESAPQIGQKVYMFARLRSETEPRLFPAKIVQVELNWLLYTFEDKTIDLAGTSGAPVLDDQGKVIGMHVGGGAQHGELTGAANPAARMKENLALQTK